MTTQVAAVSGRLRRTVRSIVAAGTGIALIAGCGTIPGAAAEVDGVRIAAPTISERTQALIDENLPDALPSDIPSASRSLLDRYQLTDLIRHELVRQAAAAHDIEITAADVNGFIAQNGGPAGLSTVLTVPVDAIPDSMYDYLALEQLLAQLPEDGVSVTDVQVTLDVVTVPDRATAVAERERYLQHPDELTRDAQVAGSPLSGEHTLLTAPENALIGVYSAAKGDILIFPNGPASYNVIRITDRVEVPAQLTAAQVRTASGIDGFMVLASLVLADAGPGVDVTVNPRFGQWDARTLLVLPANYGL